MAFHVICISHADGASGDGIGREVAARLGFRYVNEEIILEAARQSQLDPKVVAAAEHKQSFLQRLLDSLSTAQEALGAATLGAGIAVPTIQDPYQKRATKEDLRSLIRATILEVAKAGRAVIVTHAASLALAGKPGVLRVLVTAPPPTRAERVARERNLSEADAADAIREGDSGRREYLRNFYDLDEELPTHYDLVINTEILTPAEATALILAATANG